MMTSQLPLFAGLVVGFSVAVPIGPMGLLCIQRTLASGPRVGICTGLGAATVNVLYGALIMGGLNQAGSVVPGLSRALGIAGGAFLLWCAARTFTRRRAAPGQPGAARLSPLHAYASALAFSAGNPVSPVVMLALLSPLVGVSAPAWGDAAAVLLGIFAAAVTWWVCLSTGTSLLRSRLSPRVLEWVNAAAATMMTIYGALALARSASM